MNHLKLIFGCGGKKCTSRLCLVKKLVGQYPKPSERLNWWNGLSEGDKTYLQNETFICEQEDN